MQGRGPECRPVASKWFCRRPISGGSRGVPHEGRLPHTPEHLPPPPCCSTAPECLHATRRSRPLRQKAAGRYGGRTFFAASCTPSLEKPRGPHFFFLHPRQGGDPHSHEYHLLIIQVGDRHQTMNGPFDTDQGLGLLPHGWRVLAEKTIFWGESTQIPPWPSTGCWLDSGGAKPGSHSLGVCSLFKVGPLSSDHRAPPPIILK